MYGISLTAAMSGDNLVAAASITNALFQINRTKLYVIVVTLSKNDNIKFLENMEQGFKRTSYWNK